MQSAREKKKSTKPVALFLSHLCEKPTHVQYTYVSFRSLVRYILIYLFFFLIFAEIHCIIDREHATNWDKASARSRDISMIYIKRVGEKVNGACNNIDSSECVFWHAACCCLLLLFFYFFLWLPS